MRDKRMWDALTNRNRPNGFRGDQQSVNYLVCPERHCIRSRFNASLGICTRLSWGPCWYLAPASHPWQQDPETGFNTNCAQKNTDNHQSLENIFTYKSATWWQQWCCPLLADKSSFLQGGRAGHSLYIANLDSVRFIPLRIRRILTGLVVVAPEEEEVGLSV